ncbi:MAG TPA: sigma-70 family RNA polymerase sigma factor [Gemmataceae bacterium]|nr:sigma-70 family RNA polymerase sigma factor [Gemmataceae bacterium]
MVLDPRGILGFVRREAAPEPADAELLARFSSDRDERAFAELVRRHGPMVFGVCRRLLPQWHDAEDASQAVFLALACKPGAVRPPDRLAAWLHGVACRVARQARRTAARRSEREARAAAVRPRTDAPSEPTPGELSGVIDGVLLGLPERYRAAVVLCDLEGLSRKIAAARLGWSEGLLSGRLARARRLLADRLARRGVALGAAGLGVALSAVATPAAGAEDLIATTLATAARLARGLDALPAGRIAALARGATRSVSVARLHLFVAVLGAAVAVGLGSLAARPDTPANPSAPPAARVVLPDTHQPPTSTTTRLRPPEPVLKQELKTTEYIGTLAWSPDGSRLATQSDRYKKNPNGPNFEIEASTIRVWDVGTGKEVLSLGEVPNPRFRLQAFSADGKSLLVINRPAFHDGPRDSRPRELEFWDVATGRKKAVELDERFGALTFAPDRKTFASGFTEDTPDGRVSSGIHLGVYDDHVGGITRTLRVPGDMPRGLAYSADGKRLASVALGPNQTIRVWDLKTGEVERELAGADSEGFVNLAFSPDAKVLACAGGGPELQRWGLTTGKALPSFAGNGRRTNAVAFSPDGRWLMCIGWAKERGGEVALLDARIGERLQEHAMTSAAAFCPGRTLWAVAYQDRGVKVWGLKGE